MRVWSSLREHRVAHVFEYGHAENRNQNGKYRDGDGQHLPQAFVPTANFQVFPHDSVGFGGFGDFDAKSPGGTVLVQQTLFDLAVLVFVDIVFLQREKKRSHDYGCRFQRMNVAKINSCRQLVHHTPSLLRLTFKRSMEILNLSSSGMTSLPNMLSA